MSKVSNEYLYHVELNKEYQDDKDWYFGSIASIYVLLDKDQVGVGISALYAHQKKAKEKTWIYRNNFCTIKKTILIRKKQTK